MKKIQIFKDIARFIITVLSITLIWSTIVYGCVAFTWMEYNPKNWNFEARVFVSFFGVFVGMIISTTLAIVNHKIN